MPAGHETKALVSTLLGSRRRVAGAATTPEQQRLIGPILAEIDRAVAALDPLHAAAAPLTPLHATVPAPAPEQDVEALRRELERLRALVRSDRGLLTTVLNNSPHGILVSDAHGKLTLHNRAAERIWAGSATAESVDGWGRYRAFHADGRPYEPGDWSMARALSQGEVVDAEEVHFQRFDGTHGILLGSAAPVYGPDGAISGAVATFADITRFKQLERDLHLREAWLSTTLRSIADGVVATDGAGRIEFMNAVAERVTGFTMAEALGRDIDALIHVIDEGTRARVPDLAARLLRDGAAAALSNALLVPRGGGEVAIDLSGAPIRNDAGDPIGVVLVLRDVSERLRLYREEQRVNRVKDEFLATLSHELRTPLNAILGWARLFRMGKLDERGRARALETIERNAEAQAQLIEDLLDVSRIISGKFRVDVRPVDLCGVTEAAIEAVRLAAEAKAITLGARIGPVPPLAGDPTRLQQVVWNLLCNAIKFTPKGGRVDVRLGLVESHVEIAVEDTGQGIRADFLPYVFDRFRQADGTTTRAHNGLGLGLAIVRHLVELHGGSVRAHSGGEGAGSLFTVKLPVAAVRPEPRDDARTAPARSAALVGMEPLRGISALVVDDEVDAREMVAAVLTEGGAAVVLAGSVPEAVEALGQRWPDVLVSDIGMPREDGYSLIRRVRAMEAGAGRLPAVALTAYASAQDRTLALAAGYSAHLPKPVEPNELIALVKDLAGRAACR